MRRFGILGILGILGCAGAARREDLEALRSDHDKLKAEMTNKNDFQVQLYQEMLAATGQVRERLGKAEILLGDIQARLDRLEGEVRSLAASGPGAPPRLGAAAPAPEGDSKGEETGKMSIKTVEQILLETESVIASLRAGKLRPEEAAHQLRPHARHAAPRLLDEMRRSLTQIEFTIQLETVLAKLPPEDLKAPLRKALEDASVRLSAARIVGAAGDLELSRILEEAAAAEDEDLRLVAGESLVRCRNAAGIPALVRCLRSPQRDTRTIAISALRPLNRGLDFGYRASLSPEENAAALQQWEEWAEKLGKVVFDQ